MQIGKKSSVLEFVSLAFDGRERERERGSQIQRATLNVAQLLVMLAGVRSCHHRHYKGLPSELIPEI